MTIQKKHKKLALFISTTILMSINANANVDLIDKKEQNLSNVTTIQYPNYTPRQLPPRSEWFDVTQAPNIVCNGTYDDTAGFKSLINDTSVTNWYIGAGKQCRFYDIAVKPHLKAVHGEGTIIVKSNSKPYQRAGSHTGLFSFHDDIDGFLLANLNIRMEHSGWRSIQLWGNNGLLSLSGMNNNKNIEARNCDVDLSKFPMNFIKGYVNQKVGKEIRNISIVNNTIKGFEQFAIEILPGTKHRYNLAKPIKNLQIIKNKFIGLLNSPSKKSEHRRAVSLPGLQFGKSTDGLKDGTEAYIVDNLFIDAEWGIEGYEASGLYVHNNLFKGAMERAFQTVPEKFIPGKQKSYYFHNVVLPTPSSRHEGGWERVAMQLGGSDKVYENYIGTVVRFFRTEDGFEFSNNILAIKGLVHSKINNAFEFTHLLSKNYSINNNILYTNSFVKNKTIKGTYTNLTSDPKIPENWGIRVPESQVGAQR